MYTYYRGLICETVVGVVP